MPPEWKSQIPLYRNPESACYWSQFQSNGQEGDNGYGPDRSKKWFESYLTDRMQSTRLGTSRSEELIVTHGVPQGSILGPLLFSLYMNDLSSVVKFSSVKSYVDDTKVYLSFSSKDIDSCLTKVTEDLRLIAAWCCTNKLLINPSKTKLILFGIRQLL